MMRFIQCLITSAAVVAAVSACSTSAPINYYTLQSSSAESQQGSAPSVPFLIEVLPVGIPERYAQPQLVVRRSDSSIAVLDGERWGGPFEDELREALSTQLAQRLGTQDVSGLAQNSSQPVLRALVQIRRLDAWLDQQVILDADWSLGFANDAEGNRLSCHGHFVVPAKGSYPELVRAQQIAVGKLAERMVMDTRAWSESRQATCSVDE